MNSFTHTFDQSQKNYAIGRVVRKNLTCFGEVKEKSSHYGLNMLGYTCATRVKTVGNNNES